MNKIIFQVFFILLVDYIRNMKEYQNSIVLLFHDMEFEL